MYLIGGYFIYRKFSSFDCANMEVDGVEESGGKNQPDGAKFANLKAFVNSAREFEATHSEAAVNMMTRYLGVSF